MEQMKLTLRNFRRFEQASFKVGDSTLFVGPNGTGKTTILEAIHYLSLGRSHRTSRDQELIGWDTQAAHARLALTTELVVERSLAVQGASVQRKARRNGVETPLLGSLGLFQVVLFAPELLGLIVGPPAGRRRYLDMLMSSTEPPYALTLAQYAQAVRQRNELLARRVPVSEAQYDPWEALLAARGQSLVMQRQSVVQFLGSLIDDAYASIAGPQDTPTIELRYQTTVPNLEHYQELLVARRETDLRAGATTLGPHRDDLIILVNGRPAAQATSRGEQRSLLLALKRAELQLFEAQQAAVPPILLLDDMFSELDARRSRALAELIQGRHCLITATDATQLPEAVRDVVAVQVLEPIPLTVVTP